MSTLPSRMTVIGIKAPGGVVIKVEATGLCRSDWHGWVGHDTDIVLPHVPGHELAGVVESVAENTADAVVGVLLWGAIAGPAGVAAYRTANTLDAMVGLMHGENIGKMLVKVSEPSATFVPSSKVQPVKGAGCEPAFATTERAAPPSTPSTTTTTTPTTTTQ